MRILFLTRLFWPHIGGVEKHVGSLSLGLRKKKHKITIFTQKYEEKLKNTEIIDGIRVIRFSYPQIKYFGLLYIWFWLLKNRKLIEKVDIIHCHDVFIWYLPFRFLYPKKRVYTTFHGWEGIYPIPLKNILLKKLAAKFSRGNICVGRYIEKYYGIKSDFVTYGAIDTTLLYSNVVKNKKLIVFIGRLEKDTGLLEILKKFKNLRNKRVIFCGDGVMRQICEKYGQVLGFVDPKPYLAKASICFPSGYLSALEAMAARCEIVLAWDSPVKRDYWTKTPFYKWIKNKDTASAYNWVKGETWDKLADSYLSLWRR